MVEVRHASAYAEVFGDRCGAARGCEPVAVGIDDLGHRRMGLWVVQEFGSRGRAFRATAPLPAHPGFDQYDIAHCQHVSELAKRHAATACPLGH